MMIMLDQDDVGAIKFDDVREYLMIMTNNTLLLSMNEVKIIFDKFDKKKNGTLDKKHLEKFLATVMKQNCDELSFNSSKHFQDHLNKKELDL